MGTALGYADMGRRTASRLYPLVSLPVVKDCARASSPEEVPTSPATPWSRFPTAVWSVTMMETLSPAAQVSPVFLQVTPAAVHQPAAQREVFGAHGEPQLPRHHLARRPVEEYFQLSPVAHQHLHDDVGHVVQREVVLLVVEDPVGYVADVARVVVSRSVGARVPVLSDGYRGAQHRGAAHVPAAVHLVAGSRLSGFNMEIGGYFAGMVGNRSDSLQESGVGAEPVVVRIPLLHLVGKHQLPGPAAPGVAGAAIAGGVVGRSHP